MNLNIIIIVVIILCLTIYLNSKNIEKFAYNKPIIDIKRLSVNYGETNDEIIVLYIEKCINNPAYIKRIKNMEDLEELAVIRTEADLINDEAIKNKMDLERINIELIELMTFKKESCRA